MNDSTVKLLGRVRAANLRGILYPVPSERNARSAADALCRAGVLIPVSATATSLRGYAAVPPGQEPFKPTAEAPSKELSS